MPVPTLADAWHVRDHVIHVVFTDGVEADLDLRDELWGEVFEPLKDVARFRTMRFDRELNTVTWNTGADFAPEFLYERAAASRGMTSRRGGDH
ncbi:MAG: DUF2442 domain-containing protein [Planctomycetes bacterium]|nr:DUF2442 domain-containing protein [Planctomycetota bacterium]